VDESGPEDAAAGRQVDLSLTPLVSVIEALRSPVAGCIAFDPEPAAAEGGNSGKPGAESAQFAALLESLDEIASAIQVAVDTQE